MFKYPSALDKLIVFISCSIVYLSRIDDMDTTVVPVLISVIFSGFLSYFDDDRVKTVLTIGFSAISCIVPELTVFLPLIVYDMLYYRYQYMNLLSIVPIINFIQSYSIQLILIVMLLLSISILLRYRAEAQINLHAKYNDLRDTTREMSIRLQKQNTDLLEKQDNELNIATLNERNRIAREIHDNVGHLLSSAILQSGALLAINKDEKVKESLETLNDTLSQAMNSIRTSVHELYDESIDLNAQIEEIINKFTFCEISYENSIYTNPGKKLKYTFISIVNEALSNMIRHSDASHAYISFREHPAIYQLIIKDNGKVKAYSADDGLGLKNMYDRVHSFNGIININIENGFEIFISIPKEGS